MKPERSSPRIQRPYCLHCYAPIPRDAGAIVGCEHCGARTVLSAHRVFWTREPKLVETEWLAKVGVGLGVAVFSLGLMGGFEGAVQFGTGHGWAVGCPLLAGAALWETAGKITRHKSYLNGTLLWTALPGVVGGLLLLHALFGGAQRTEQRVSVMIVAMGFGLFALLFRSLGRRFGRWKERHVLDRQERLRGNGDLA